MPFSSTPPLTPPSSPSPNIMETKLSMKSATCRVHGCTLFTAQDIALWVSGNTSDATMLPDGQYLFTIPPPTHFTTSPKSKIYRCLQTLFPPSHSLLLAPSDTLKINLLSIYELCSGAHSGCCMVASAAGGLPLRLQWWIGCMVVVAWMDWCAVECGLRRRTSASHDLMSW